ncbi:MAG: hypothetical protein V4550_11425 [Gemmatimonadota bacterium]
MRRMLALLAVMLLGTQSSAVAQIEQRAGQDTVIVVTVPLKHLSSQAAVMLLTPYAVTLPFQGRPAGGVFQTPDGQSVTIRETVANYGRMLSILQKYDRGAETVGFTFQLIAADKSNSRSPEIASLDSLLRSVLKYTGYKLIGTSVLTSGAMHHASETVSADGQKFTLNIEVEDVRTNGADASVKLKVSLDRNWVPGTPGAGGRIVESLLSTGLTVPIGQTVVLGTAALDKDRAIILTVRPQLSAITGKGKDE